MDGYDCKNKKKGKTRIHLLPNGNRNSSHDLKKSEYPCGFFDEINTTPKLLSIISNINDCCNGRRKTVYGYIWKEIK